MPSEADLAARIPITLAAFHELVSPGVRRAEEARHAVIVQLEPGEYLAFAAACEASGVRIIDQFARQLDDLSVVRFPSATTANRADFMTAFVSDAGGHEACGRWVYLPWEGKVAHVLGPDEYFEVITNRNRDKITALEQQLLRNKNVGVMGLSLGAEAAVTLAQEHLCGHLVLADFDRLDLSNLNRLGGGFDDLGLQKTTIAARRIAKIDPYLRLTLFDEGVTTENAPEFLAGLDLLVEECDGLTVKFEIRTRARNEGLNIVFAGDERGFLSIEPHAHDRNLPVFHGEITEAQPPRSSFPSSQAFLSELTKWLGGWERISERTRRSLERVGGDLCGYPQLASEARLAAAQVGHVARRLLLGERLPPFLGHLDLEELIPGARR